MALDKRKLPAALVAEAFDPACSFKGFKSLKRLRAFEAEGKINSFRPQAAELLSFVKSDKRKVTKEKRFSLNQLPARSVPTRACATRDILSRWRTAHIHVRRPPGVLLFSRVRAVAALDELRDFRLKQKSYGLPGGAAQTATSFGQIAKIVAIGTKSVGAEPPPTRNSVAARSVVGWGYSEDRRHRNEKHRG
ncbi:hypothetical protein [Lysobacter capsici]|uniref:hypothetical protein n=1 Tax=Lysobacter capsici TaxID=435897 RepID=UPI001C007BD3|nr:hypothetical protein [Lysobacter capsici]QWF18368.1 hypothetical protein KME82_06285 [Lysobacter capsici]